MKKISVALLTALFSATIIHSSWAIGDVNVGGEGIKEISLPGMGIPQDQSLAPRALPSALNNEEGLGINMGDETEGLPTVQQVAGVNIEPIASAPQLQAQSNAPTPTGKIKTSATVPTQTAKLLQSSAKQVALIGSKLNGQPPSQDASMESLTASGKPFDGNDAVMATDDYNTDNRQRVMDQTFQSLFGDWKDANHAWTSKEKLAKKMAELIQREIADELIWQDLTGTYYEGRLLAPAVLPLTVAIAHMAQTTPNKKAFLEQVAELERRINAILYSTSNPDKALQGIISAINGNPQSNARPIAEFTQAQSNAQHPIPETSILFTRSSYHDDQQLTDAIRGAVYFGYMTLAGVDYVEIRTPTIDDAARIAQTLSALSQVNAIFVSPATLRS